jgi:hypothetical protein
MICRQPARSHAPRWQARRVSFESIRSAAAAATAANRTLCIADDTLHLPSMRRSLWSIARECAAAIRCNPPPPPPCPPPPCPLPPCSCPVCSQPNHFPLLFPRSFVHITAPLDLLLSRNSSRPHPVPSSSLLKIASTLQPPHASRHYYETPVLTLQGDALPQANAAAVADWLRGCWQVLLPALLVSRHIRVSPRLTRPQPAQALRGVLSPQQLQQRTLDKLACSRNIKHALDLASRRAAGGARRAAPALSKCDI